MTWKSPPVQVRGTDPETGQALASWAWGLSALLRLVGKRMVTLAAGGILANWCAMRLLLRGASALGCNGGSEGCGGAV